MMKKLIVIAVMLSATVANAVLIQKTDDGWVGVKGRTSGLKSFKETDDGFEFVMTYGPIRSCEINSSNSNIAQWNIKTKCESNNNVLTLHLYQENVEGFQKSKDAVSPSQLPEESLIDVGVSYTAPSQSGSGTVPQTKKPLPEMRQHSTKGSN